MHKSVTIQDVYEALKRVEEKMVTREDIEALVDSVEILRNPKTMEALRKSDRDIKACRVKEVTSVIPCHGLRPHRALITSPCPHRTNGDGWQQNRTHNLSFKGGGGSSEEPDEGKLQVQFCEGVHSSFPEEVAMSSTRQNPS